MKPPLLQWANGADSETAIKIGLKYPATGTATFDWSKVMPASANQRYTFPREIWSNFEKTAKGSTGKITIQRIVGAAAKNPIERSVQFASGPLRGNIFYTQYGRTGGSKIMRLNPGGDTAAVQAFATDNGCPVCHSMSANGTKFATSNANWSTNAGISNVDTAGNLTVLSDFVNTGSTYSSGGSDWRGFAWAPLTPDGKYIFTANNIWGNSRQSVVGIDTTTRTVNTPLTYASGGNGTGLLADYFMVNNWTGWSFRRFDPKIDFDWAASPGSAVPADNFSVRWTGKVEPFVTETHTFEVETTAGVKLTVGGTVLIDKLTYTGAATKFTGSIALTRGTKTAIVLDAKDQAAQTMVKLRWSSPSTLYDFVPMSQLYPDVAQRGALVTYADTSGNTLTQLEPDILENWGTAKPAPNINADNFTSTWDALIEAPVTGANLQWCLDADEGVVFSVNGVQLLSSAVSYNNCIATLYPVVQGTKYAVRIVHTEKTSNARIRLGWQMSGIFNREDVTSARTFPPASWSAPTSGLAVTWYDTSDFGGSTIPANVANPQGYKTYVPNLNWDFGSGRLNYGTSITSNDTWAGRFTGRLIPACTGLHEFSIYADDTVKLWLNGERVALGTSSGTRTGAFWMDSTKTYDFKLDWSDTGSNSGIVASWRPACNSATMFSVIPQANFLPSGDTTIAGQVRTGGDNGNGSAYWAWETPNNVGDVALDVTSSSPGNWGLGSTIMMLPNFSPDSKKLVFVDGDSSMGAGWRKGLSTFEFEQGGKLFKNRRAVVNTWPSGDVIKWPFFESDSRSVLYQTTTPGEVCCRNGWTLYGYNGPTNYFEDPGRLWSVDTQAATPTPVLLSKLNDGERVEDKNKAYQPTMLPSAASGYRWAVFTSTRPYGNMLNLPAVQQNFSDTTTYTAMTNYTQLQSQLWVAAIDDVTSGATDRSHPAFWLPNQAYNETASSGYLNERAYWVAETCRPIGTTAGSVCDVDEDCCGGTSSPRTSVCRIDAPVTSPVTRHCAAAPTVATCKAVGVACSSDDDCCLGTLCSSGACAAPPPLAVYAPANFVRLYESQCKEGTRPKWRFFDWQVETPSTSFVEIYAESVDNVALLHALPKAATPPASPGAVMVSGVVKVATLSGAQMAGWTGADIGKLLDEAAPRLPHGKYLQITMRLIPDSKKLTTPLVKTWRQAYSCVAAE